MNCEIIYHQFTPDNNSNNVMVRVNEDSWTMYCAFLCSNAGRLQLADGPGQWWVETKYK